MPSDECGAVLATCREAGAEPFLVGMLADAFEGHAAAVEAATAAGTLVVVDMRSGDVSLPLAALELLPQTGLFQLRQTLSVAASALPSSAGLDNEMVYAAFRAFLARVVGHYEQFFAREYHDGAPITFDEHAFLASHTTPEQRVCSAPSPLLEHNRLSSHMHPRTHARTVPQGLLPHEPVPALCGCAHCGACCAQPVSCPDAV